MKAVLRLPSGPFLQDAIVSLVDKPAERKDMHRTTTVMLRTYLRTASAMAGIIQVGAIGAIVFLRIPASAMESSGFRVWALAGIIVGTAVVRQLSRLAFQRAMQNQVASVGDSRSPIVIASGCPLVTLVLLHLKFARREFVVDRVTC
jgi:hypothetical protein